MVRRQLMLPSPQGPGVTPPREHPSLLDLGGACRVKRVKQVAFRATQGPPTLSAPCSAQPKPNSYSTPSPTARCEVPRGSNGVLSDSEVRYVNVDRFSTAVLRSTGKVHDCRWSPDHRPRPELTSPIEHPKKSAPTLAAAADGSIPISPSASTARRYTARQEV